MGWHDLNKQLMSQLDEVWTITLRLCLLILPSSVTAPHL